MLNLKSSLQEELKRLEQSADPNTWGMLYVRQISTILQCAKPARIHIPGLASKVKCNESYMVTKREEAGILSLDDEQAAAVLADGRPDGKCVLMRNTRDRHVEDPVQLLQYIEDYRLPEIDIQVLDDAHPPGLCEGEEGRCLFKFRNLTAPFQERPHHFVAYIVPANFDVIGTREMTGLIVDFLTESSQVL